MMKRMLYWLYQPYQWLVLIPCFALWTLFCATLTLILCTVASPRIASMLAGTAWGRLSAYLTPVMVRVVGREHVDKKQSYVIVSNHQSSYDIFVLYGWLGVDFRWVMKQEVRRMPAIGYGCETIGHIFIDRSNTSAALSSINAAKGKIVDGTSIVFFPEGTRSKDGKLGRFKKGAFRFAMDAGLPILPVTIEGTRDIMPTNTVKILPGRATLIFHEPVNIAEYDGDSIRDCIKRVKETIASGLESREPSAGGERVGIASGKPRTDST
ncbi:MAG: 1-acyl-sn-glycerol-3-phosphate acyltransferase [bacterium]|nr:1-acyl-sn-glycerol-3-phosphate acyltransferase [bacterium]